jgi:hypothetical protein
MLEHGPDVADGLGYDGHIAVVAQTFQAPVGVSGGIAPLWFRPGPLVAIELT